MYKLFATGIGSMIAIMIMVNSLFAEKAGYLLSMLVIQLVGVAAVSLLLVFRKERDAQHAPFYLYSGGIIGLFLIFSNNYCFQILGASLTLALGIIGQSVGSVLTDRTGFLGMKKYPFNPRKIVALGVALVGIVLMIDEWRLNFLVTLLAFFTGAMVLLSMIVNTQLALRVGLFKGTRINFITGFLGVALLILFMGVPLKGAVVTLSAVHPVFLCGGGILGVLIVAGINHVLPKIPTLYSTLFITIGQMLTGFLIDFFLLDIFSFKGLIGLVLVTLGVSINLIIDRKEADGIAAVAVPAK